MKKLPFFITFILFVNANNIQAQFFTSIGLRSGLCSTNSNMSEIRDGIPNHKKIYNLNSFFIEIQTEYLQRKHFSLLTNLSYLPKGYSYYSSGGGGGYGPLSNSKHYGNILIKNNASYLDLITAPKLSIKLGNLNLYCFTGLHFSLLTYAEGYYNTIFSTNPNSFNPNYEKDLVLNRTIWGGTFGCGIETNVAKKINYSLQVQYMYDFSNAADYYRTYNYNNYNYDYRYKAKYQTLIMSFSFHYKFKKNSE